MRNASLGSRKRAGAGLYVDAMTHDHQKTRLGDAMMDSGRFPVRRSFRNGRMPLSYMDWGNEGAPLAVMIHGNRDHARSWDALVPVLARDYHVVAPDLRGHGDSSWSADGRYDYSAYLSDIAALCDHLEVEASAPVMLIGHSLGAHVAIRYAGAMPDHVSALIGIEAVGAPPALDMRHGGMPLDERLRHWFQGRRESAAIRPRGFASIGEAVERMLSRHPYLTLAQARHLTRHGVRRRAGRWQWKYDPYVSIWPFPELEPDEADQLWRGVACPTLLIYGDQSWPSSVPGRMVKAIAGAREVRLPRSGHWPQHDATEDCHAALVQFLAGNR